ncbi:MAG: hypothetical protein MR406_11055, partial [Blautia sp.]|nr:hypothetical protein [Blautia sp.]
SSSEKNAAAKVIFYHACGSFFICSVACVFSSILPEIPSVPGQRWPGRQGHFRLPGSRKGQGFEGKRIKQ